MQTASISTEIIACRDLPENAFDSLSSRAGLFFSSARLKWLWEDPRWVDMLVAVHLGKKLSGLLPISICRVAKWYDQLYDVTELTGKEEHKPTRTCLIGGRSDVRASMLFDSALTEPDRYQVAEQAVQAARDFARKERLRCVTLYLPEEEVELAAALKGSGMKRLLAQDKNVLRWERPTVDSYLSTLMRKQRQTVMHDWRQRSALGHKVTIADWDSMVGAAAPLVNEFQVKHGQESHSTLVRRRLQRWGAVVGSNGFALRGEAMGECTGYAFCWYDQDRTVIYEIGFHPNSSPAIRRIAYVDLMIYTPLALSCQHGITSLELGMYADKPKRFRGAIGCRTNHWVQESNYE